MSLILEVGTLCPHRNKCSHNTHNECWGAKLDRDQQFVCEFYKDGRIQESGFRNPLDQTGKMQVIMD